MEGALWALTAAMILCAAVAVAAIIYGIRQQNQIARWLCIIGGVLVLLILYPPF